MEKKCENCKHAYYVYNCEFVCKHYDALQCNSENLNRYEPKISEKTNRQWLESLSDEELTNEINDMLGCEGKYRCFLENTSTLYAIKDWLQTEHKE